MASGGGLRASTGSPKSDRPCLEDERGRIAFLPRQEKFRGGAEGAAIAGIASAGGGGGGGTGRSAHPPGGGGGGGGGGGRGAPSSSGPARRALSSRRPHPPNTHRGRRRIYFGGGGGGGGGGITQKPLPDAGGGGGMSNGDGRGGGGGWGWGWVKRTPASGRFLKHLTVRRSPLSPRVTVRNTETFRSGERTAGPVVLAPPPPPPNPTPIFLVSTIHPPPNTQDGEVCRTTVVTGAAAPAVAVSSLR